MGRKKKLDADFLDEIIFGEQWCPYCNTKMQRMDGYWECQECNSSVTDEDVADGYGCSTLEESEQESYDRYYENITVEDIPEGCTVCGGPYPDCMSSCKLLKN